MDHVVSNNDESYGESGSRTGSTSISKHDKFSDLPKFLGKSRDIDAYVKTIQSQIDNAGNMFPNDSLKTSFFGLWLGPGVPEKWFHGVCESQPELINNYPTFIQAFTDHFGDPDSVKAAHQQFGSLRQTRLALTYVARFQEIAVHCCLSEYSMHTQFVDGLKPEVQLHMLCD